MLLYEFFSLKEADFANLDLGSDTKMFIDPFLISTENDDFSRLAAQNIRNFFKVLLKAAKDDDKKMAQELLYNLHERNETRIGYSKNKPRGIGFAGHSGMLLFDNIKSSKAMQTGLINDIFDCSIMVDEVGPDKVSDLITNILFLQLVEYTETQCKKYGIPLHALEYKHKIWNYKTFEWEKMTVELPFDDEEKPIIFLPKEIVTSNMFYTYQRVYNGLIIPFYEDMELQDASSGLVYILKTTGERKVSKGELKKKYPCSKDEVSKFIKENPQLYSNYKNNKFTYEKKTKDLKRKDDENEKKN